MMQLFLNTLDGESYLDASIRMAREAGIEEEVRNSYRKYRRSGDSMFLAAWHACHDWELLQPNVGP